MVAGPLTLVDLASGAVRQIYTADVDISYTEWRSEEVLLIAGHRGLETVVGLYDRRRDAFTEVWASAEISTGGRYVSVSGIGDAGDCVMVGEGFVRAPEIAVLRAGRYVTVKSFDLGYADAANAVAGVDQVMWQAPDGLDMQGWLLRPHGEAPFPTVMNIHGGPVWLWRPMSLMRARNLPLLMLLSRGYAVFLPNPRGSSGRGVAFARHVVGDMGGADTHDYLSGLTHLAAGGAIDPGRLGVTGVSYGGFMTAWLITQDPRFAAAVAIAPISNHVTEHLISNAPDFTPLFLNDHYSNLGGKYAQRSPIMHAHKARTPILNICGLLDRTTPPEEAIQFHNAILENGGKTVLVSYPEEGHGIHKMPASIDFAARLTGWFVEHLSP